MLFSDAMSRSRKKFPAGGNTVADSDRLGKSIAHRRTRRKARLAVLAGEEPPSPRLTENPLDFPKDGKRWYGYGRPELMRK
jgi:CRISPR/Cas system Type II protein with McrA/HNH and RuvC-like nuclease domain